MSNQDAIKRRVRKVGVRGFTMLEVLVTIIVMSIGIVGALGAVRSIETTQAKAKIVDHLQELAAEKINDLSTISDPSQYGSTGDFSDRGYPDAMWTLDVEPTSVTNLDLVTVTVTEDKETESLTTQMFVQSESTSSAGTTSTGESSRGQ